VQNQLNGLNENLMNNELSFSVNLKGSYFESLKDFWVYIYYQRSNPI
jgi:hypothetical protein